MNKVHFNKDIDIELRRTNIKIIEKNNQFFLVINDDFEYGENGQKDGNGFSSYDDALLYLKKKSVFSEYLPKTSIRSSGILSFTSFHLLIGSYLLVVIIIFGGVKEVFSYFNLDNSWLISGTTILLSFLAIVGIILPRYEKFAKKVDKIEKD